MEQKDLPTGIGAIGSGRAQFFHPSAKNREKWPQDDKCHLSGVLATGEGQQNVKGRQQNCYIVQIPIINDGSKFFTVKNNFQVDIAFVEPFPHQ